MLNYQRVSAINQQDPQVAVALGIKAGGSSSVALGSTGQMPREAAKKRWKNGKGW
jgi:hypothetical protein